MGFHLLGRGLSTQGALSRASRSDMADEGVEMPADATCVVISPLAAVADARGAQLGAHTATMPAKTFRQLMSHPLTDRGLEGFMRDWAEVEAKGNA